MGVLAGPLQMPEEGLEPPTGDQVDAPGSTARRLLDRTTIGVSGRTPISSSRIAGTPTRASRPGRGATPTPPTGRAPTPTMSAAIVRITRGRNLTMRSGGMEAGIAAAADHATLRTRQRALEAGARSCSCSESPMSHSIGGHSPTKRARRSALPRSSWSTVLARIHNVMHRPTLASDARCRCQLRGPAWWRIFVNMLHGYPAVAIGARLRGSLGSTA